VESHIVPYTYHFVVVCGSDEMRSQIKRFTAPKIERCNKIHEVSRVANPLHNLHCFAHVRDLKPHKIHLRTAPSTLVSPLILILPRFEGVIAKGQVIAHHHQLNDHLTQFALGCDS
jgi:hypothetical protein